MSEKATETVARHEHGCPRGSFPDLHCICPGGPVLVTRKARPVTRGEFDTMVKRVDYLESVVARLLRGIGRDEP